MSDIAQGPVGTSTDSADNARVRARYAKNLRLQLYGIGAIVLAIAMLFTLLFTMVSTGYLALTQTHVTFDVPLPAEQVDVDSPLSTNWSGLVNDAYIALFDDVTPENEDELTDMLSSGAQLALRERVVANPELVGRTISMTVPFDDDVDQLEKGVARRDTPEERRQVSNLQIAWYDALDEAGRVTRPLNWALFTNANSRYPELAGLKGAILGSFYALVVCFFLSFPIGISSAVYLEEFAPKNRWTDLIEVNINNLAAVPSIVFGLLGLAVFINFLGFPRSVPLVGGMVLSLMTLPTIIISTRAALKAVPPSIREAALGMGASRLQVVTHHVLPLAMPGIMTGTIIGMAQALGETAPLLLIGMNAFITAAPDGFMSASTALPTQIYIWADSPERGFTARTSAAILVLLGFMILMNGTAVFLRKRLERKW